MFELNLIKDKARARQRRRVIFLTITSVCFLAGLCSLFVVSLYLSELNATNDAAKQAAAKEAELNTKKSENDKNDPIFKRRRNEVIKAWTEDTDFLARRPYYSPVLKILSTEKPGAPFWFSTIEFRLLVQNAPGAVPAGNNAVAQTPKLLLPRGLRISGMISINESDVKTQQALLRMDERMNDREGFVQLVGPAKSVLDPAASKGFGGGQGGGDASRWNEFTVTTSNVGGTYGP
jgi:hypothetical protein